MDVETDYLDEDACPNCRGMGVVVLGPPDPVFGEDVEICQWCLGTGVL